MEKRITDRHLLTLAGLEPYERPTERQFWELRIKTLGDTIKDVLETEYDIASDTQDLHEELEFEEAARYTKIFEELWSANTKVLELYIEKMQRAVDELKAVLGYGGDVLWDPQKSCTEFLKDARRRHKWHWDVAHDIEKTSGLMAEITGDEAYGRHELFGY